MPLGFLSTGCCLVKDKSHCKNAHRPAKVQRIHWRIDIPKDDVPYLNRRLDGIKYLDTGKPEWIEMKPIIEVVNEALKAAGKN